MNSTLVYWVSVLGQFFGLCSCLILGTKLGAKLWPNVFANLNWMLHLSKHLGTILALVFCSVLGYAAHDLRDYYAHDWYTKVLVLKRNTPRDFTLHASWNPRFSFTSCSDEPELDWQQGQMVARVDFIQKNDCKSLRGKNLGFTMEYNSDGSRKTYPIPQEIASE